MGTLLLLLLGGAAATVGVWAALSRKGGDEKPPFFDLDERIRPGPRSSPGLPEPGQGPETGERGRPVVISPGAVKEFRDALGKGPMQVEAKVVKGSPAPGDPANQEVRKRPSQPLKVSHDADDIVARSSKHAHQRRALQNADSLIEKQKGEEAKAIYERVRNRVDDPEIHEKIDQNIEDINRWLEGVDQEEDPDDFIQFPQIVIPMSTQSLALENLTEGLRRVSESLVDQLNQAAARLAGFGPPPGSAPAATPGGQGPVAPGRPAAPGPAAAPAAAVAPVVVPVSVPSSPPGPSPQPAQMGAAQTAQVAAAAPGVTPIHVTGPVTIVQGPPGTAQAHSAAYEEKLRLDVAPPRPGHGELLTGTVDLEWARDSVQPGAPKAKLAEEPLPPGLTVNEDGELVTDGWTDADFEKMWEKFRNLPLKDRRSGKDRRVFVDRRLDKRKDRRSGFERRKNDLFKEREEFLKKLAEHKKRKKQLEDFRKGAEARKKEAKLKGKMPDLPDPQIVIEKANITIGELDKPEAEEKPKAPEEKRPDLPPEILTRQAPPELDAIEFPEAEEARFEPDLPGGGEDPELAGVPPEDESDATEEKPQEFDEQPGEGVESFSSVAPLDEDMADEYDSPPLSDEEPTGPVQEIRGVLELKPPDEDDAPFLTLTYDFGKIPDSFQLSRDYNTMEYAYYKYKPMLLKAQEFTRRKMLKNALNYYRVIKSQAIPPEMKRMINRNIQDITEYLEKFLMSRG